MTPTEHARLIDAEEFQAECKASLERAFAHATNLHHEQQRKAQAFLRGDTTPMPRREPPRKEERFNRPRGPGRLPTKYTYNGETKTAAEWANGLGLSTPALFSRIKKHGLDTAIAMGLKHSTSSNPSKHTYNGETKTTTEWAAFLGITLTALFARKSKLGSYQAAIAMGGDRRGDRGTQNGPGVVLDFQAFKGTGGGSSLQETPNITFSKKA